MTALRPALWSLTPDGGAAVPLYVSRLRLGVRAEIDVFEAYRGDVDTDELTFGSAAQRELALVAILEGESNLVALENAVRAGTVCALSGDLGAEDRWQLASLSNSRRNALNIANPVYALQIGLVRA